MSVYFFRSNMLPSKTRQRVMIVNMAVWTLLNLEWSGNFWCQLLYASSATAQVYLGLVFTANLQNMEQNIDDKIASIKKIGKCWKNRHLSIYGKNTIAKCLMLSKINNVVMVLPNLKKNIIEKCEKIIYSFLWNDKNDQVRRQDAKVSEAQGGLNLPDLSISVQAFKIQCSADFSMLIPSGLRC